MWLHYNIKVPSDPSDKSGFIEKLLEFSVSLRQYENSTKEDDVTMYVTSYNIHVDVHGYKNVSFVADIFSKVYCS